MVGFLTDITQQLHFTGGDDGLDMGGIKQDAFCPEWQSQIKKIIKPLWPIKWRRECLYQRIYMGSLPVSTVFNAPQRPCSVGNLRPATVSVNPLIEGVLMKGNILTHFIRVDSALLLVATVESIIEMIDNIPSWLESMLELATKHLFIGLNQFLIFHIDFF